MLDRVRTCRPQRTARSRKSRSTVLGLRGPCWTCDVDALQHVTLAVLGQASRLHIGALAQKRAERGPRLDPRVPGLGGLVFAGSSLDRVGRTGLARNNVKYHLSYIGWHLRCRPQCFGPAGALLAALSQRERL
jgi:hypothetical protein